MFTNYAFELALADKPWSTATRIRRQDWPEFVAAVKSGDIEPDPNRPGPVELRRLHARWLESTKKDRNHLSWDSPYTYFKYKGRHLHPALVPFWLHGHISWYELGTVPPTGILVVSERWRVEMREPKPTWKIRRPKPQAIKEREVVQAVERNCDHPTCINPKHLGIRLPNDRMVFWDSNLTKLGVF